MTGRKKDAAPPRHELVIASDAGRRAAADLAIAVRRVSQCAAELDEITGDKLWRPGLIKGPLRADLVDARRRIGALLGD